MLCAAELNNDDNCPRVALPSSITFLCISSPFSFAASEALAGVAGVAAVAGATAAGSVTTAGLAGVTGIASAWAKAPQEAIARADEVSDFLSISVFTGHGDVAMHL